ncbi:MAG: hypothetical protein ABL962_15750, partial [Fimbriimonadaceae bacterium]
MRNGDSLLGVTERQLEMFSMDTSGQSEALLLPWVPEYVEKVRNLRLQISRIPSHDPEAIRRKQRLFDQVRELEKPLKFAADALIACELSEGSARDKAARRAAIQATLTEVPAEDRLQATFKELTGRPTFHWNLEFPDVFEDGGFNGVVGNPPFAGGKTISASQGVDYHTLICALQEGVKGTADLSAHFIRRGASLVSANSSLGLIANFTIAQTDNRESSLDVLLEAGWTIYRALSHRTWPGEANISVALLWLCPRAFSGEKLLDGNPEELIPGSLRAGFDTSSLIRLRHEIRYSAGIQLYGKGFVLDEESLERETAENPGLRNYLRVYVNGEVLNDSPVCDLGLRVVDFEERELDEIEGCELFLRKLTSQVKEERKNQTRQVHESRPWLHWDKRTRFIREARKAGCLLACSSVSRRWIVEPIDPSSLPVHRLTLWIDTGGLFAALQSTFHEVWARSITLAFGKSTLSYSTSDIFDTFPLPRNLPELAEVSSKFYRTRSNSRRVLRLSLNQLYEQADIETNSAPEVMSFRDAIIELDNAVKSAYGWNFDLDHGFQTTQQGARFTISSDARKEVLRRLLKLNHERYAEEVAAGLHDKKGKKASGVKSIRKQPQGENVESAADFASLPKNLFDAQLS